MKMHLKKDWTITNKPLIGMSIKSIIKSLTVCLLAMITLPQAKAQIIFEEHFNNLSTAAYATAIPSSTFDAVFDNTGWTSTTTSGQSCAEVGSLCLGKSGTSGSTITTKAMDLSGSATIRLSFKLKYYGPNSITASTSSKIIIRLDGVIIFSGVQGIIGTPSSQPNYTASDWTSYTITIVGGTAASKIAFAGTSANYSIMFDDVVVTRIPLGPATLSSTTASSVTYTTATVGGTITSSNIFTISERGVVWSTSPNPLIGGGTTTKISENPLTGTADFSINLTGLTPGQTYYYKAYDINNYNGSTTSYGEEKSFIAKTLSVPTLTTTAESNLTSFGVQTGGNITDDGGSAVTARGVAWSTGSNPIVAPGNSTSDGSGIGSFNSQIYGLTASTVYHVSAYASNSIGTSYGNEISFTTAAPQPTLFASTSNISFPVTAIGGSNILTYTLTGSNLTPNGTITITSPAGFATSPATINYTGTSFTQIVTVTFSPPIFGNYSGTITQSGGGATGLYIVNPNVSGKSKLPIPAIASNVGNDFWLGFGYHTGMSIKTAGEANISIYVSAADRDATVVVEMPGLGNGFTTQEVLIPAGTVQEISGFPRGDNNQFNPTNQPDSRLYFTGITNRAIHVYSKDGAPVSVWMYTYYTNNSAAGCMIFPTNTWNTGYAVQAYGNNTNTGIPNSFFYVIGEEDGTEFDFVPSVNVLDSASGNLFTAIPSGNIKYFAGQTYHITLNRGQVFNAMGGFNGNKGLDLSGTTVKSTNCKKIAVFGGNGRCLVDVGDGIIPPKYGTSGSDNLVQQMFPKVAWGTKYYTVPTKHMEFNAFRINVDDTTTKVWVNDPTHNANNVLKGLTNGYYKYDSNQPLVIESDKPISVIQFIVSQAYTTGQNLGVGTPSDYGMNGIGDPEMIILSPAEQAINKVTVYSPTLKNNHTPSGAYINVVIPKAGISTFALDPLINPSQMIDTGSSSYNGIVMGNADALIPIKDAFKPYAVDSNYYWAKFKVNFPAQHTLESNVPFNAIAYGTSDGESYGFNAGTELKDISEHIIVQNPYAANASQMTCRNIPFYLKIVSRNSPAELGSINWNFSNNPNLSPNTAVLQQPLIADSSYIQNGQTFYIYKNPNSYSFNALGTFSVTIQLSVNDGCYGSIIKNLTFNIGSIQAVKPLTPVISGPSSVSATLSYTYSVPSFEGGSWQWFAPAATISNDLNTADLLWNIPGQPQLIKVVSSQYGCILSDTATKSINVYPVYTFNGNGDWNIISNWISSTPPPDPMPNGILINIDPIINGECFHNGALNLPADVKLYVKPGKKFKINQ